MEAKVCKHCHQALPPPPRPQVWTPPKDDKGARAFLIALGALILFILAMAVVQSMKG